MSNFNKSVIANIFCDAINHFCCIFYIILEKFKDCCISLITNLTVLRNEWCNCNYTVQLFSFAKLINVIL